MNPVKAFLTRLVTCLYYIIKGNNKMSAVILGSLYNIINKILR